MISLSRECPACGQKILLWKIKTEFFCPKCNTMLSSNNGSAQLYGILIYILSLPILWWLSDVVAKAIKGYDADYSLWRFLVYIFGLVFYAVFYVFYIKINNIEPTK